MKTGLVKTIAAFFILAMVACNNDKTEETKAVTPASSAPAPAPVKVEPKTEVSVGPGGAEVKTKDVKVKFDTKDSNQK